MIRKNTMSGGLGTQETTRYVQNSRTYNTLFRRQSQYPESGYPDVRRFSPIGPGGVLFMTVQTPSSFSVYGVSKLTGAKLQYRIHPSALRSRLAVSTPKRTALGGVFKSQITCGQLREERHLDFSFEIVYYMFVDFEHLESVKYLWCCLDLQIARHYVNW